MAEEEKALQESRVVEVVAAVLGCTETPESGVRTLCNCIDRNEPPLLLPSSIHFLVTKAARRFLSPMSFCQTLQSEFSRSWLACKAVALSLGVVKWLFESVTGSSEDQWGPLPEAIRQATFFAGWAMSSKDNQGRATQLMRLLGSKCSEPLYKEMKTELSSVRYSRKILVAFAEGWLQARDPVEVAEVYQLYRRPDSVEAIMEELKILAQTDSPLQSIADRRAFLMGLMVCEIGPGKALAWAKANVPEKVPEPTT